MTIFPFKIRYTFNCKLILGDPGAVSRIDKMFVVKVFSKIDLTEIFHPEHFIVPTNCPWVSGDAVNCMDFITLKDNRVKDDFWT